VFFYERYADDMLFGFPKGNGSEERIQLFRKRLARALGNLGLKAEGR
jgi:hypothetical protein